MLSAASDVFRAALRDFMHGARSSPKESSPEVGAEPRKVSTASTAPSETRLSEGQRCGRYRTSWLLADTSSSIAVPSTDRGSTNGRHDDVLVWMAIALGDRCVLFPYQFGSVSGFESLDYEMTSGYRLEVVHEQEVDQSARSRPYDGY